jgi:hypothetical protein
LNDKAPPSGSCKKIKKISKNLLTNAKQCDIINTTNEGNEGKPHLIKKGNKNKNEKNTLLHT